MAGVSDANMPQLKVAPPMIVSAKADEGDGKTVYIGPRKVDEAPQATFHYGDGKWLMKFSYTKSSKAKARGGDKVSNANPRQDKTEIKITDTEKGKSQAEIN
jgi:hypothetical protein